MDALVAEVFLLEKQKTEELKVENYIASIYFPIIYITTIGEYNSQ